MDLVFIKRLKTDKPGLEQADEETWNNDRENMGCYIQKVKLQTLNPKMTLIYYFLVNNVYYYFGQTVIIKCKVTFAENLQEIGETPGLI